MNNKSAARLYKINKIEYYRCIKSQETRGVPDSPLLRGPKPP